MAHVNIECPHTNDSAGGRGSRCRERGRWLDRCRACDMWWRGRGRGGAAAGVMCVDGRKWARLPAHAGWEDWMCVRRQLDMLQLYPDTVGFDGAEVRAPEHPVDRSRCRYGHRYRHRLPVRYRSVRPVACHVCSVTKEGVNQIGFTPPPLLSFLVCSLSR